MDFSTSFGISFLVPTKITGEQRTAMRQMAETAENNLDFQNMLTEVPGLTYQPQQINSFAWFDFPMDMPLAARKALLTPQHSVDAYKSTAELLSGDNPQVSLGLLGRRVAEVSNEFSTALKAAGIPRGPETLTFDEKGALVVPEGYDFEKELHKLFASHPELKQDLSDVNRVAQLYLQQQDDALPDDLLTLGHTQLNLTRTGYISGFNIEV